MSINYTKYTNKVPNQHRHPSRMDGIQDQTSHMAKLLATELMAAIDELMVAKMKETKHQKLEECVSQLKKESFSKEKGCRKHTRKKEKITHGPSEATKPAPLLHHLCEMQCGSRGARPDNPSTESLKTHGLRARLLHKRTSIFPSRSNIRALSGHIFSRWKCFLKHAL